MIYNPYFDGRRKPPDIPDDAEYNEVDQYGRRFRKVGNCIEYEPEINGMPRSVFFASQKAQKQRDEENRRQTTTGGTFTGTALYFALYGVFLW